MLNVTCYILGLTGYHHEPMKVLQIMWLITETHQTHRCRTKLVLLQRCAEIMAPGQNALFDCMANQLNNNPQMIAANTRVTSRDLQQTVHNFLVQNRESVEVNKLLDRK